jgi:DNA invertase Pin-like site-specific DNA recombinase
MTKTYGYCRISTPSQSIERQIRNIINAYPDAKIVQEVYTGTTTNRPKWDQLRKKVQQGDTVVFDSVSRMSRNAAEGATLYEDLYNAGVNLVFLKEPHINTSVYRDAVQQQIDLTGNYIADQYLEATNRVLLYLAKQQIRLAFDQAEKEVQDLRERTREGMMTAKINGKQIGAVEGKKLTTKKSIDTKAVMLRHCKDFGGTLTDKEVITLCGIARNTFYKYKREIIAETR